MQRLLLCVAFSAIIGTFVIGAECVLAEEGVQKQGETQTAPKVEQSQAPATTTIEPKPASSEESQKETKHPQKDEKPDKKPAGCKGGMLTMGVGC